MTDRIEKKELVRRLANRMGTDEKTAQAWLEVVTETYVRSLKKV